MFKWHVFVAFVIVLNMLAGVGFTATSVDIINRINSGELSRVIGSLLWIEIVHPIVLDDGTILLPPTSPANVTPNYPFILFWVTMLGNLVFMSAASVLLLREKQAKQSTL
jgi:hypothetical protein